MHSIPFALYKIPAFCFSQVPQHMFGKWSVVLKEMKGSVEECAVIHGTDVIMGVSTSPVGSILCWWTQECRSCPYHAEECIQIEEAVKREVTPSHPKLVLL